MITNPFYLIIYQTFQSVGINIVNYKYFIQNSSSLKYQRSIRRQDAIHIYRVFVRKFCGTEHKVLLPSSKMF